MADLIIGIVCVVTIAGFAWVGFLALISGKPSPKSRRELRIVFGCWTASNLLGFFLLSGAFRDRSSSRLGIVFAALLIGIIGGLIFFVVIMAVHIVVNLIAGPRKPKAEPPAKE